MGNFSGYRTERFTNSMLIFEDYPRLVSKLNPVNTETYDILRHLARTDLFFLLWFILQRKDAYHPWIYQRCLEVSASPDGHLDLWARGHYKSSIITFAKTIQDILVSHGNGATSSKRELTFGIFSHTRPLAKGFLRQIKREFESNFLLKRLFPDILWDNPHKESPKWSEDDGIILKRNSNPKESTVEAWGIVDGQPTGKHFDVCVYDDIITNTSVSNPTMIEKVTSCWELSLNLSTINGIRRYIGTRYHFADTYKVIMERGAALPRLHTATDTGTLEGRSVYLPDEKLKELRRLMGPYTFGAQMMQNPIADERQGFKYEWLMWHDAEDRHGFNVYLIVDPANAKKKNSDYTAMMVIGLGSDENYYVLDMVRDRLNLTERSHLVFNLHRKWRPNGVGYEHYGMQADIQYLKEQMKKNSYHFQITELKGGLSKVDRIRRLIPLFETRRIYFPVSLHRTDFEGKTRDLVAEFVEQEYKCFPAAVHDDVLDALSRLCDPEMGCNFPLIPDVRDKYAKERKTHRSVWAD